MAKQKKEKVQVLEQKAILQRQKWNYHSTEPIQLKKLLFEIGVVALFRPMSLQFSGMAIRIRKGGETFRFMMINSDMPVGRQNFTICHELYHLYVQENFETRICKVGSFDKKDPEEYNADTFAVHFLLPAEALLTRIPAQELDNRSISLSTILRIEHLFECSREFLLIRLKELNLITDQEREQFQKSVKSTAQRYGFPPYLYTKSAAESVVGDYASLANDLFDSELVSENHYYSLMEDLGFDLSEIDLQEDEAE
ncbi:ImmA/IrrE family metallo-endopeptidase [Dyadobacter pollutisoli]|uniref:ImmA/IrrE family metallo-endopeptidase n=1 Tax=Dyadobacter pollutisoli TaxID=2910158 RepID=A0A9E8SP25_9BACT|nr:ImmA/IrrE family metallo-endopeptidase [Dyadobacter pollutisoli]WAC11417.1 ImmA/IrrE family metallo-endopeptidase [Dyadobacter pollutisoli]